MTAASTGRIYVYRAPGYAVDWERTHGTTTISGHGRLKVGETSRDSRTRVEEQLKTAYPDGGWELLADEEAVRQDGSRFSDTDVHHVLDGAGIARTSEVVDATLEEVLAAIAAVRARSSYDPSRTLDFPMRPEQEEAVERTATYFLEHEGDARAPRFLWNAKMRFGKTFTTYQLALEMGWKRILVLTYKPAVRNSWRDDLNSHIDFAGWDFVDRDNPCDDPDTDRPLVWFASFQDLLGKTEDKAIKGHNETLHLMDWDCIVLDEYHYGAWQGAAKEVSSPATVTSDSVREKAEEAEVVTREEAADAIANGSPRILSVTPDAGKVNGKEIKADLTADDLRLSSKHYLYLSGTPFRALTEGEFNEDAIFSWTYPQEQQEKRAWTKEHQDEVASANPYFDLPEMQMFTYALPRVVDPNQERLLTEEFDLSRFFEAKKQGSEYHFTSPNQVTEFLDMLHGKLKPALIDKLEKGRRPPFPFSDARFTQSTFHSVWLLPTVASVYAMKYALESHPYFRDFIVHAAATAQAGTGAKAKEPVDKMLTKGERDNKRTITLSVSKLMTGVTIPQWGAILILRSLKSPEAYFQSAFRVQSPWTGRAATGERFVKKDTCYVFDFDPQRALSLIYQYGTKLAGDATKNSPADVIEEMIDTLPIFAFDGSRMDAVDVNAVMDWATAGAGAAMLAKRWGSHNLIDLSEDVLTKLLADEDLLARLGQIEDFRNLREDASKILASSQKVRDGKKKATEDKEPEDPETLEARKRKREQVMTLRKKLLKFVQTIPVFMYLTDHREQALVDVIRSLDTQLFERVTGLTIEDFEHLSDVGVFQPDHMNEAIWQFRIFEKASLDYLQLHHDDEDGKVTGLWDTTTAEPLVSE